MTIKIIAVCLWSIGTSGGAAVLRRCGLTSRREMHARLQAFKKETAFQTLKDAGIGCWIILSAAVPPD